MINNNIKSGVAVKTYPFPTKRYVQTLTISDDPELIELYKAGHTPEGNWKEIRDGIREVGILEMEIYIHGNILTMIVETPQDFDWDEAMARLATLPRQAEWEAHVARYQGCDPDAKSDQKWQLMERMFRLY